MNPNPGKIKIETSEWPKNENKCWYRIESRKHVLKLRLNDNIVIAPAKTGKDKIDKITVIENKLIWS